MQPIKISHALDFATAFLALNKAKAARKAAEDQYQQALNDYHVASHSLHTGLDRCELQVAVQQAN